MKKNILLFSGALIFSALILYRATVIPFTHDEASTLLNYRHLNVWSCLSNYYCWVSANNHWLNTLLLQWTANIGGDTPLAIRFPNVLTGIGYFFCAALLCLRYLPDTLSRLAGFLLLVSHVYLLDFFSLARGYGLMACGVIWGIYFLTRYLENYAGRWLIYCNVAFFFAILSNFTGLLPWSAALATWGVWMVIDGNYSRLLKHSSCWILSALFFWLLLDYPLRMVASTGDFLYGADHLGSMVKDLIRNLLYGRLYAGENTILWFVSGLCFWVIVITCVALFQKQNHFRRQILFLSLLLLSNLVVIFLQQKLFGTQAPEGRRSIYFIPVMFMGLAMGFGLIQYQKLRRIFALSISFLLLLHFIYVIRLDRCREWYYDAFYPELFSTLLPEGSSSDSIALGTSWIFNPVLRYYQQTLSLPVSGLVYQRPLIIDSTMQYYYLETPDTSGMSANGFVLEKNIGMFFLFKKATPAPAVPEINSNQ